MVNKSGIFLTNEKTVSISAKWNRVHLQMKSLCFVQLGNIKTNHVVPYVFLLWSFWVARPVPWQSPVNSQRCPDTGYCETHTLLHLKPMKHTLVSIMKF